MYDGIYDPQWMEDTSMTNSSTHNNQDDELTFGIDMGAPDSDETALAIKIGKESFIFNGKEAEAILAWHNQQLDQAMPEKLK